VVGGLGRYQQVNIDRTVAVGCDRKPQLDVGEDQSDIRQPAGGLVAEDDLIVVDAVVVGDAECFNAWLRLLHGSEVRVPSVGAELIVSGPFQAHECADPTVSR